MMTFDLRRRLFLSGAAGALAAACALPGPAFALREEVMIQTYESQSEMTPDEALGLLKAGNARFVASRSLERDLTEQVEATASGQFPFAAVVTCIDSRTSGELIFDQGIGDIFSARIAGNYVNDDILGSLEFACALSGAMALVVVGHTNCGAIRGAADDVIYGNLTETLANLKPAVAAVQEFDADRTAANPAFVQAVAEKNVELTLQRILDRSPILESLIDAGDLILAGAMYDIHTGEVVFT